VKNNDLHNKKLTEGLTTPNDYFDTFEDRFFEKLQAESILPKEEGFKVPDAYFDGLEDILTDKLFPAEQEETKVIQLASRKTYLKYIGYVAAACTLLFVISNFITRTTSIDPLQVTSTDINTFIENDLIAINNYELATAFEEENIDISTIFEVDLNETETIDYLENTSDPYDLLIE